MSFFSSAGKFLLCMNGDLDVVFKSVGPVWVLSVIIFRLSLLAC